MKRNPDQLYSERGIRSVAELMKRDLPVAQLQVTLFDDASLVGLTTPHVLCDGHGNKEIARAVYLWATSFQSFPVRNCFGLVADDPRGGIWMGGVLAKKDAMGLGNMCRSDLICACSLT